MARRTQSAHMLGSMASGLIMHVCSCRNRYLGWSGGIASRHPGHVHCFCEEAPKYQDQQHADDSYKQL